MFDHGFDHLGECIKTELLFAFDVVDEDGVLEEGIDGIEDTFELRQNLVMVLLDAILSHGFDGKGVEIHCTLACVALIVFLLLVFLLLFVVPRGADLECSSEEILSFGAVRLVLGDDWFDVGVVVLDLPIFGDFYDLSIDFSHCLFCFPLHPVGKAVRSDHLDEPMGCPPGVELDEEIRYFINDAVDGMG